MTLWWQGHLVDDDAVVVRADDHGLTLGDGVFETLRVVDGVPQALTRHLTRLARSAATTGLPVPVVGLLREAVAAVCSADGPEVPRRLRVTWTAGPGPLGPVRGSGGGSLLVASGPAPVPPQHVDVVTVPWVRNERSPLTGVKSTSWGEQVVMLEHARARGASEVLLGSSRGELAEGAASNVLLVLDGRLVTPATTSGVLPGIVRGLVVEWFGAQEVVLPVGVLAEAEEVLLTSSLLGVVPVRAVDGRVLPSVAGAVGARVRAELAQRLVSTPDP